MQFPANLLVALQAGKLSGNRTDVLFQEGFSPEHVFIGFSFKIEKNGYASLWNQKNLCYKFLLEQN